MVPVLHANFFSLNRMSLAVLTPIIRIAKSVTDRSSSRPTCESISDARVLVIPKRLIGDIRPEEISQLIRKLMRIDHLRVMQIVGDSACSFSPTSAAKISQSIENMRRDENVSMILYGLTGKRASDDCVDINHITNSWLDSDPVQRSRHICGVVTDVGTYDSVSLDGYGFSLNCNHFIVVNGGATFGDDILLTDPITDVLLLFEGGIQSFAQAINVLRNPNSIIHAYVDLRSPDAPQRFSAARFLQFLVQHEPSPDLLDRFCSKYSPVSESQQNLLQSAWSTFLADDVGSRLNRVVFHYP